MLASTTSMVSRTRSTVCWRLMAPVSSRGAAPKTEVDRVAELPPPVSPYQSTKPLTPAWTITPTHDRSSALRSSHHDIRVDMAAVAAVLSPPVARWSAAEMRSRFSCSTRPMVRG